MCFKINKLYKKSKSIASSAVDNLTANMLALQVLILQTIALTTLGMAGAGVISISHHISINTIQAIDFS